MLRAGSGAAVLIEIWTMKGNYDGTGQGYKIH